MTIGGSIFLISIGAILRFAIEEPSRWEYVNVHVVGVILMIAGALGLVLGLVMMAQGNKQGPQPPQGPNPPQPPTQY